MTNIPAINLSGVAVARLDEYFGLWAIEASRGLAMFNHARSLDLASHVETTTKPRPSAFIRSIAAIAMPEDAPATNDGSGDDSVDEAATVPQGSIAVINIVGTLMKQQSSLDESTSTIVLRKQIREVKDDPRFVGAILCMDSPGGSVAGTSDLGDDIAALAAAKPVIGHVQDLCASACYWAASQCTEIYANNPTALVGSIGTFIGTYDYSKMCEKEGIAAKVYATGPLKGAGFPGAEITPEQDKYFQGIVDNTQRYFAEAVAKGRGMSMETVNKVATGAAFLAGEALDAGLIDGIKSFDQCLTRMGELLVQRQGNTSPGTPVGAALETRMNSESQPATNAGTGVAAPDKTAENATDPKAEVKADVKRFVDAFGGIGATWYLEGKTFEECTALHNKANADAIAALKQENQSLKTDNASLKARVQELRGESTPVSANVQGETPMADLKSRSTRLGPNLARVANSIVLPKTTNN